MAEQRKLTELERVQAKAVYNYKRRLREQEEEKAFKASLDSGQPLIEPADTRNPQVEYKKGK